MPIYIPMSNSSGNCIVDHIGYSSTKHSRNACGASCRQQRGFPMQLFAPPLPGNFNLHMKFAFTG